MRTWLVERRMAVVLVESILLLAGCGSDGGGPTGPAANSGGAYVFKETLGDHLFEHFVAAKREEWLDYIKHVSPWEIDRYLGMY